MDICNGGRGKYVHDEIVHNEKKCPLCEVMIEIDNLEFEITKLNDEINKLNSEK